MNKGRKLFTPLDLQILVGVAAGKTQARIAAELELAQPAVSKHLAILERESGVALVHRDGRRLRLTPTGYRVAERAKSVLTMLDDIEGMVTGTHADGSGTVRIAACTTPGGYALPPAIGEFLRASRDVNVEIDVQPFAGLWRLFNAGGYDLAVFPEGRPYPPDVTVETLYEDPLVVFAHPEHPLAQMNAVSVEDLSNERLVGRFIAEPSYWQAVFGGQPHPERRHKKYVELQSLEAAKRLVETGFGIGILYESVVQRDLDEGRLKRLNVGGVNLRVSFLLAQRRNVAQTPAAKRFAAFLREYFQRQARAA